MAWYYWVFWSVWGLLLLGVGVFFLNIIVKLLTDIRGLLILTRRDNNMREAKWE